MKKFRFSLFTAICLMPGFLTAQAPQPKLAAINCGRLIDGKAGNVRENVTILVEGNTIRDVGPSVEVPLEAEVIDLSTSTVLPGLIDCHTHVLLQGDITSADYDEQLLKES